MEHEESLEDLEARLYAQVYHDNSTTEDATPSPAESLPPNLNKQSSKRYWQKSKNISTQFQQRDFTPPNQVLNFQPKTPLLPKTSAAPILSEKSESESPAAQKTFVPYSSVLSFMQPSPATKNDSETPTKYEKKRKAPKFPKAQGKQLNPQGMTKGKALTRLEIQKKKQKAALSRKKAQNRVVTTIELDDSDESDCVPVELPPPPLISIESSDDEDIRKKRALSPSSSSIISDDFIVAGDKKQILDPFHAQELRKVKTAAQQSKLDKVKAMMKVPSSTSSSSSARSSCERNEDGEEAATTSNKRESLENTNEDTIYATKAKTLKPTKEKSVSESSEEAPCVNATELKSTRHCRNKSVDSDKSEKLMSATSTPIVKQTKRSRYVTPSYTEDEFASMITTIMRDGTLPEVEEDSTDDPPAAITIADTTLEATVETPDCVIVERPVPIVNIADDDEDAVLSDSDADSIKNVQLPVNCDLSLNVTQTNFEPHEYIRDAGAETSQMNKSVGRTRVDPEIGWNDEMKFFYDGSWGGEHFNVSNIYEGMPVDRNLWRINNADRNRMSEPGSRIRCKRCNEFGHIAVKCNRPRKRVVCFMCGEEGHRETRCPNSICLRCGKPNKLFATVCSACHKNNKKFCPLCNYQGHDIDQCPDKWRRYHSTTSDTTELCSDYKVNDRVYCSICARRGHFAENCNQFQRTISGMITSSPIKIVSHKSSYPRVYCFDSSVNQSDQHLLALYTYIPFYTFNFQFSKIARLYAKFLEQFEIYKKSQRGQLAIESGEKKSRKRKREKLKKHDDDSNSNYSFSEFYQKPEVSPEPRPETAFEKSIQAVSQAKSPVLVKNPFATTLPEFIPLSSDGNANKSAQQEVSGEKSSNAKMVLTKDHFAMLQNEKGQNFLYDLQCRLHIEVQFKWDSTGNSLLISGLPSNHAIFHVEVREFLFRQELDKHERNIEKSTQLPKSKQALVSVLRENLQSMSKFRSFAVKKILESMLVAEKSLDFKKMLKCRKSLNIAFLGQAELCKGDVHVGALRRILFVLEKELKLGKIDVSPNMRDEIMSHMKPIFGTTNHGDYRKLFGQYMKVIKQRQKNSKLLKNPILS